MRFEATLTPSFQQDYRPEEGAGFRVRVEVTSVVNLNDASLFAYRALPREPGADPEELDLHYDHVCSPVDLEEFPIGEPLPNASPPWCRLHYVDFVVRSRELAEQVYVTLLDRIQGLMSALERAERLTALDPVVIGAGETEQ